MLYEESIATSDELFREIMTLDSDAGIRIDTVYRGEEVFIFITRSSSGFVMAVHRKKIDDGCFVPGDRIAFMKFESYKSLRDLLSTLIKEPISAFKY